MPKKDKTPKDSPQPAEEEQPQEGTTETESTIPFDLSRIDPKKLDMAEEMGIPVRKLIWWVGTVEARFNALQQNLPQLAQQAMEQAIENIQKKRVAAMQKAGGSNPAAGGGGGLNIAQLLQLAGVGGSADEEMMSLTKDMYRLNIQAMKEDLSFTRAIKNALVTKIAGKAVQGLGEIVEG